MQGLRLPHYYMVIDMNISFYKISDPPEKLNKTLGSARTISGTVRGEIDRYAPDVTVGTDVSDYNYMYIPDFGKYYFINGCTIVRTGIYRIEGVHEDVLMSFKSGILAQRVIIDKSENVLLSNPYINDGSVVVTEKTIETKIPFENGFNTSDYRYVLITAGNDSNITGS